MELWSLEDADLVGDSYPSRPTSPLGLGGAPAGDLVPLGGAGPQWPMSSSAASTTQNTQGTAEAVIAGVLTGRQHDQLRWVLDELVAHHEQPSLGGSPVDESCRYSR